MKNVTGTIFLLLSSTVAFFNILLGHWQYVAFVVPFIVACAINGRIGKVVETAGLVAIGLYVLLVQSEYAGIVVLYAATVWFYAYVHRDWRVKAGIIILTSSIFIASYGFFSYGAANKWLHAALDAAFYCVGAFTLIITLETMAKAIRKEYEKPVMSKYIGLIEGLSDTLHEALDTLKDIKEGADDGRSK